jgi:hypothetical protein
VASLLDRLEDARTLIMVRCYTDLKSRSLFWTGPLVIDQILSKPFELQYHSKQYR